MDTSKIIKIEQVTVSISEIEAKRWALFMRYYDTFALLAEKGVLDQKNAAITLNFDKNGILQTVQREDFLYSRKHEDNHP